MNYRKYVRSLGGERNPSNIKRMLKTFGDIEQYKEKDPDLYRLLSWKKACLKKPWLNKKKKTTKKKKTYPPSKYRSKHKTMTTFRPRRRF